MDECAKNYPNPWLTGFTQPKQTIRTVLETDPKRGFWQFLLLNSFVMSLSIFCVYSITEKMVPLLAFGLAFLVGMASYLFAINLMGWALKITGRMLGGLAGFRSTTAIALWSSLPNALFCVVIIGWIASLLVLKPNSLLNLNSNHQFAITLNLTGLVIFMWQLYLLGSMIREVQGFSVSRTTVNIIAYYLLVIICYLIVLLSVGSVIYLIFNNK